MSERKIADELDANSMVDVNVRHGVAKTKETKHPPPRTVESSRDKQPHSSSAKFQDELHRERITGLTGSVCKSQPKPDGVPVLEFGKKLQGCHYLYPQETVPRAGTIGVLEAAAQTNPGSLKPADTGGNSDKLDLADAYRQALKETVYISLQEKGGDEDTGSGVVVGQTDSKTYILTANHVVSDPLEHSKDPKTRSKHTVTNREVTTTDGDKYSARLLNKDPEGDIALIEINVGKNSKHHLQVASVVEEGAGPKPKDSVVFAGYPEDTTNIYMSPGQAGDVLTKLFANSTSRLRLTVLNMRAKGSFGDSGGPVFNAKHQLVGLVEGGTHHDMDALILSKKMLDQWLKPYGIKSN